MHQFWRRMLRKVDVNRERVLGLIKTASVSLTTKEIGRILKVKERSVRAAVTWLVFGGYLVPDGAIITQTTPGKYGKRKFKVQVYKWTGKIDKICKVYVQEREDTGHTNYKTGKPILAVKSEPNNDKGLMLQNLMMGIRR
jgi:hypothetical protein